MSCTKLAPAYRSGKSGRLFMFIFLLYVIEGNWRGVWKATIDLAYTLEIST